VLKSVRTRHDIPKALQSLRARSGVEVGVHRGRFSRTLLLGCSTLETLFSVDVWLTLHSPGGSPKRHTGPGHIAAASARLAEFGDRSILLRASSLLAAELLRIGPRPREFDFLYIDVAHDYDAVRSDLEAWWPHLADHPRAIFAGHDYHDRRRCGVKRAVDEFAAQVGLPLFVTGNSRFPSWLLCRGVPG